MRLTSSNIAAVGLSLGLTDVPASEVTVTVPAGQTTASVVLHGLGAPSTAAVSVFTDGHPRWDSVVRVLPLAAGLSPGVAPDIAAQTETTVAWLELVQFDPQTGLIEPDQGVLRAGGSISVRLRSSNPAVVGLRDEVIQFDASGHSRPVEATGLRAGSALVEIQDVTGASLVVSRRTTEVRVRSTVPWAPPVLVLGENLQAGFELPLPWPATAQLRTVRVTSTDPARLLLTDGLPSSTPQATVTVPAYSLVRFGAHGLASAGEVSVRAETEGQEPVVVPIRLRPAGMLFERADLAARVGDAVPVRVSYHPIDPATQLPGAAQAWRSGVPEPAVQITVDNPAVAVPLSTADPRRPNVVALQAGTAVLTLAQPAGMVAARTLSRLTVNVQPGWIQFLPAILGTNLQTPATRVATPRSATVTLISTEPDKLVLSSNRDQLGTSELTVSFSPDLPPTVFLQSLGQPGFVWVLVRAAGFRDERFYVRILPSTWRWAGPNPVTLHTLLRDYQLTALLDTIAPPGVNGALAFETGVRPGLGPLQLFAAADDPAKLRVRESAITIGSRTTSVAFTVEALAAGATRLTLTPPPAFTPSTGGDLAVHIEGPPLPRTPLRFVAVTPCRVADTRPGEGKAGAFGPPFLPAGQVRTFPLPASACGIPGGARAYSLNVTVVPHGGLSHLTAWPTGVAQPLVSTLNSFEGRIVANAAIVPAGGDGSIHVFVTDPTDLILDINGYFVP